VPLRPFEKNPFMTGYGEDFFSRDPGLGHRLPFGCLIGRSGYVSLKAMARRAKAADSVVLCLGDSSTSGWNGEALASNGRVLGNPFFSYKTYPDLLEERYECVVLNAGVPGYSSFQGLNYGARLLASLKQYGVHVSVVSVYFGNNDATYGTEDRVRFKNVIGTQGLRQRVAVDDFARNLRELWAQCRAFGAVPISVVPLINRSWPPGVRTRRFPDESAYAIERIPDQDVRADLIEAVLAYRGGDLRRAAELDIVLPRIKGSYIRKLRELSIADNVPLVDIEEGDVDDGLWFLDYCHVVGPGNHAISDGIAQQVGLEKRKRVSPAKDPKLGVLYRALLTSRRFVNGSMRLFRRIGTREEDRPSVYPLY